MEGFGEHRAAVYGISMAPGGTAIWRRRRVGSVDFPDSNRRRPGRAIHGMRCVGVERLVVAAKTEEGTTIYPSFHCSLYLM